MSPSATWARPVASAAVSMRLPNMTVDKSEVGKSGAWCPKSAAPGALRVELELTSAHPIASRMPRPNPASTPLWCPRPWISDVKRLIYQPLTCQQSCSVISSRLPPKPLALLTWLMVTSVSLQHHLHYHPHHPAHSSPCHLRDLHLQTPRTATTPTFQSLHSTQAPQAAMRRKAHHSNPRDQPAERLVG